MPVEFDDAYNAAADLLGRNLVPGRAGRVAFVDGGGEHSYAAVAERAGRFANVLAARGVAAEQRVALCLTDTVDFPACFLGAMQHGAVPIPLNTRLTRGDYEYILADSRARMLVVSSSLRPSFDGLEVESLEHVLVAGAGDSLAEALASVEPRTSFASTRRGDVAFWLYTSGTTGKPKGAVHAHSHLIATSELFAQPVLGLTADDVVFSAAKLFFAYGLGNGLTFPMAVGARAVLLEGPPTPEAVAEMFRAHRPTVFFGVPTLFGMLMARPELLPEPGGSRLRACVSAGEALPPDLARRFEDRTGVEILDGLGSTEALHIFLTNRSGDVRPGTSGRPVDGYRLRLVDAEGSPVPEGELGNLEVSGPTTALMYWNQRERTKDTFRGPWMRTGDKYRRDAQGYYHYEGRADDLMKVGGIWVSPFEVESTLVAHDAVLECAVVGHADADGLIKPKAFVVLADSGEVSDDELIEFVRERLAPYKRPRWIERVSELPKTATGKIQRFKLRSEP